VSPIPTYVYRCECGIEHGREFTIGTAPRTETCICGETMNLVIGAGVNIAPSALEVKGAQARMTTEMEDRWQKDLPAYKRMRNRGLQPKGIDGSAELENNVDDQLDIHMRDLTPPGMSRQGMRDAMLEGKETAEEIAANPIPL
jgi:hypothetical protein